MSGLAFGGGQTRQRHGGDDQRPESGGVGPAELSRRMKACGGLDWLLHDVAMTRRASRPLHPCTDAAPPPIMRDRCP